MTTKEKGQVFSLDFIIALAVVAMTIGMTLHFYELNVYEQKEAMTRNELSLIGVTASNILLNGNQCRARVEVTDMGYELVGCTDMTALDSMTKAGLMIPDGINCYISLDGTSNPITECATDAPSGIKDIAVIRRDFLGETALITLAQYENCLNGTGCSIYTPHTVTVKIWK